MKKLLATTICAMGLATGAHAATASFDFIAEAAGNEGGIEGMSYTSNGLTVTVTSSHNAYLDDVNKAGRPAGLGVCKVLNGNNQCTPSNDDNITAGESVTLTFSHYVDITGFVFHDAKHNDISNSTYTLVTSTETPGGTVGPIAGTFGDLSSNGVMEASSLTFAYGGADARQFYLSVLSIDFDPNNAAPIPLPAGLPLLAGALGMLALNRRRKAA
jgi:hypothetical protein